ITTSYGHTNVSINMTGGTISGNEATGASGGGIYAKSASITINGGVKIIGNTSKINNSTRSDYGGGGIYLNNSTLSMESGAEISGNSAPNASGGGIYTTTSGSLTIEDESSVKDNTASDETRGHNIYTKP
ncbi:MAG: hypothetical protein II461_03585, partial [Treponema sp.]|nr:hypothetical protein [Treponema sp.]